MPQYPQKGSPFSAGFVQRGQRVGPVGGFSAGAVRDATAVAGAEGLGTAGVGLGGGDAVTSGPGFPEPLRAPTWAAEAVIGFPQSMQNREVASFSRPQNEQAVNRHPPRRENLMAREYRVKMSKAHRPD